MKSTVKRAFFAKSIVPMAALAALTCLSGCGSKATVPDATVSNVPASAAPVPPQEIKQEQAVQAGENQYMLSHAPPAQRAQIQAAMNSQQAPPSP